MSPHSCTPPPPLAVLFCFPSIAALLGSSSTSEYVLHLSSSETWSSRDTTVGFGFGPPPVPRQDWPQLSLDAGQASDFAAALMICLTRACFAAALMICLTRACRLRLRCVMLGGSTIFRLQIPALRLRCLSSRCSRLGCLSSVVGVALSPR
ncbi:hypothetical protein JB92DRAFT_3092476 [Gautieria morchelliformis]|nr:hypothetical protein JB92DRAFT_3092476 [Gautieria morchelliformis]